MNIHALEMRMRQCRRIAKRIVASRRALLPEGFDPQNSLSNTFENDLALLIFNNTAIADIGDVAGLRATTTPGSLWLALYTADPGEAGTAVTNETAYTGYLRIALARSSAGWTVTGNSVSPTANVDFGECTAAAGGAITHAGVVNSSSGAGKLLMSGTLTPNITMAVGVAPRIKTTSTITFD